MCVGEVKRDEHSTKSEVCGDSKYLYVNAKDDTVVIDTSPVVLAVGLAITV